MSVRPLPRAPVKRTHIACLQTPLIDIDIQLIEGDGSPYVRVKVGKCRDGEIGVMIV